MAVNRKLTKDRWNLDPGLKGETSFGEQSHVKCFWNDSQRLRGVLSLGLTSCRLRDIREVTFAKFRKFMTHLISPWQKPLLPFPSLLPRVSGAPVVLCCEEWAPIRLEQMGERRVFSLRGGPCIVIDAAPHSPRAGNTARGAAKRYGEAEQRSLLRPHEVWDKRRDPGEPTALWLGLKGGYGGICGLWQRFG